MPRKRHKPEEIVAKLRQVDVLVSQGESVADAVRSIGVTEVTYYRWRQEFGGLKSDQVKRLKDLETENQRLRKAIADLTLDKLILQEAARGNYFSIRGSSINPPSRGILVAGVNGPAELLLLSEVGLGRLMMGSEGVDGTI
jgi:putative transposase